MDKINYILYILKWVSEYWPESKRIIHIIENNMYTEEYINKLVEFLKDKIGIVADKINRESLENAYNKLVEIRKIEEQERKENLESAELEMDNFLNM